MEQNHGQSMSNGRKILITICIVFSLLATVGQAAYLFIQSSVGDAPQTHSIFGTILWPGLLFLALWSLWGKRKALGFLTGGLIGLVLYFGAGAVAGYQQAEKDAIQQAVERSNDELPKMINEFTRMDSASIDQDSNEYTLYLSLVNSFRSDADINYMDQMFEENKPASCNSEQFNIFFSEGYSINLVYKDKNGDLIKKYTIAPSDCV